MRNFGRMSCRYTREAAVLVAWSSREEYLNCLLYIYEACVTRAQACIFFVRWSLRNLDKRSLIHLSLLLANWSRKSSLCARECIIFAVSDSDPAAMAAHVWPRFKDFLDSWSLTGTIEFPSIDERAEASSPWELSSILHKHTVARASRHFLACIKIIRDLFH